MSARISLLDAARTVKHRALLLSKAFERSRRTATDARFEKQANARPYVYDPDRYRIDVAGIRFSNSAPFRVNFLEFDAPAHAYDAEPGPAPRVVFGLWTGGNPARSRAVDDLRRSLASAEFVLITPDNLDDDVVPGHPLHDCYTNLSYVHRSDYLRSYLMHHHGGAYVDLKRPMGDWSSAFDALEAAPDIWAAGGAERTSFNVSGAMGPLGLDQQRYFAQQLNPAGFAFKPRSRWTAEWSAEVRRRLDYYADRLRGVDGGVWGDAPDYLVIWNTLHGQVFSPLCLKFIDHLATAPGLGFLDYDHHR